MSSQGIAIRRISVSHASEMPTKGIAETPGGTIFGTTPGGTRIIYDRLFLLKQKGSALGRTPPINLPSIPGVTEDLNRKVSVVEEEKTEEEKAVKQGSEDSGHNNIQEEEEVDDNAFDDEDGEADMEM
jgi:hypothetical protein